MSELQLGMAYVAVIGGVFGFLLLTTFVAILLKDAITAIKCSQFTKNFREWIKRFRRCAKCGKRGVYEKENGKWLCWPCWTDETGIPF